MGAASEGSCQKPQRDTAVSLCEDFEEPTSVLSECGTSWRMRFHSVAKAFNCNLLKIHLEVTSRLRHLNAYSIC